MSHEVRIDRVVSNLTNQPSPTPFMQPSHIGLPPLAPVLPNGLLPGTVLPPAFSMHSQQIVAQMQQFLLSLREQQHKLRLQEAASQAALNAGSATDNEDKESTTSSRSSHAAGANNNVKVNNNNNNDPQPLDLRLDSKKDSKSSGAVSKVVEDENRNLIDVVSMDSPMNDDANEDMLDDDLDLEDAEDGMDDEEHEDASPSPNSMQNELLAAQSAILSRFQNFPSSNIPPEALEQVQRTLKQMLAQASAKQSRAAQAAQSGKMER